MKTFHNIPASPSTFLNATSQSLTPRQRPLFGKQLESGMREHFKVRQRWQHADSISPRALKYLVIIELNIIRCGVLMCILTCFSFVSKPFSFFLSFIIYTCRIG